MKSDRSRNDGLAKIIHDDTHKYSICIRHGMSIDAQPPAQK